MIIWRVLYEKCVILSYFFDSNVGFCISYTLTSLYSIEYSTPHFEAKKWKWRILEKCRNSYPDHEIWCNMVRKLKEHDLKGILRPYHFGILEKSSTFLLRILGAQNGCIFSKEILSKKVQLFSKSENDMVSKYLLGHVLSVSEPYYIIFHDLGTNFDIFQKSVIFTFLPQNWV